MTASLFGTIQPKPAYRTKGRFRKETPDEFRARHDDVAWAHYLQKKKIVKYMAESNPFADLLK